MTRSRTRPAKAAVSSLDREGIVTAALLIVDRRGVDALTMRNLAQELGVAPMSLYRHVRDKEELLALVIDALAARLPLPPETEPWPGIISGTLRAVRDLLLEHPGLAVMLTQQVLFTPAVLEVLERVLVALQRAGLDDRAVARTFAALWSLTVGSVLLEHSIARAFPTPDAEEAERRRISREATLLAGDAYPTVARAAPHWAEVDGDQEFEANLTTLLAGLRAHAAGGREGS